VSEAIALRARLRIRHSITVSALAYLLTFSTYGTHLPGSEKGWVDAQHRMPGSPMLSPDPDRETYWRAHLSEAPWVLDGEARVLTLHAILGVCAYRRWTAHAVHIRTNHVHAVIAGEVAPERMLWDFKGYATRAFRSTPRIIRRRYWTDHGSTRYLWNELSVKAAIEYVLNNQGDRMACYPE
jgi:REP element-mobilizing transposase RayT